VFAQYDKNKEKRFFYADNSEYLGCLGMNLMLKEYEME